MNEPEVIPQTKGAQVPCNEDLPRNNTKIIDNGDCNQVESATSPQYVPAGKKLSSRYRGVCWNKKNKRWQAAINSSGKYLYLGSYVLEEDAARAFDRAAVRIRGSNARINFKFKDYCKELEVHNQSPTPPQVQSVSRGNDKTPQPKCMGSEIDKQSYNRTSIDPPPVRSSPQSQVGWATCLEPISRSNGLHVQKNEKSVIGNDCSLWPSPQGPPWEGPLQRISLGFKQVPCQNDEEEMCLRQQQQQYSNIFAGPRSQHQSYHPNVVQESNTFTYPQGFHQDRHVTATLAHHADGPMSTIPSDCQIVKILPHACGVLSVMYAKPGHMNTAALIWDGQEVHNMGVFTNQMDAQQACVAASSIAVKLAQNMVGDMPDASPLPMGDAVDIGQHMLAHPVAMPMDPIAETPLIPTSEMTAGRQVPQSSPFMSGGSEIRMISTLSSGDIERYLNLDQLPLSFGENCGGEMHTERGQGQSLPSGLGRPKNLSAQAQYVSEHKGNLGSIMQPDTWSSSILGLLSVSVPSDGHGIVDGSRAKLQDLVLCDKAPGIEGKLKDKRHNDLTPSICQKHLGTLEIAAQGGERQGEVMDWNAYNLREDIPDKSTDSAHDDRSQYEMDSNPATTTCTARYPGALPTCSQAFVPPDGDLATSLTLVREKLEMVNGLEMSCQERPNFHISGGCIKGSLGKRAPWDFLGNHDTGEAGRSEDTIIAKRMVEGEEIDNRLRMGTQIKRPRIASVDGSVLTL